MKILGPRLWKKRNFLYVKLWILTIFMAVTMSFSTFSLMLATAKYCSPVDAEKIAGNFKYAWNIWLNIKKFVIIASYSLTAVHCAVMLQKEAVKRSIRRNLHFRINVYRFKPSINVSASFLLSSLFFIIRSVKLHRLNRVHRYTYYFIYHRIKFIF